MQVPETTTTEKSVIRSHTTFMTEPNIRLGQ